MHGLLLIDKPQGMTSHDVVRQVRRIFKTRKVGHAGTLDPLATGVLPVAVGEGTKLLQFLLAEDKLYRATCLLGVTTETLDADGGIFSEQPVAADTLDRLPAILAQFRGEIEQVPPMYSALKQNGVPLYKLARAGKEVERAARGVYIQRLDLLASELPELTLEVECSKGTYIRSLCADIGSKLGCGAHLRTLRRLRTGHFSIDQCIPLAALDQPATAFDHGAFLHLDEALSYYPAIEPDGPAVTRLKNGVPPLQDELKSLTATLQSGDIVRILCAGHLLAMARYAPHRMNEQRGDFELIRVFNRQEES